MAEAAAAIDERGHRRVTRYLRCGAHVDPAGTAALVGACDGDLAVGVLIDAIAELLEVDAALLRADILPRVRELVFTGFLRLP